MQFIFVLFFLPIKSVQGQTTFNSRKEAYINEVINQNNMSGKIFKAYRDVPLTAQDVAVHLEGLDGIDTVDFQITEIIRLLFLTEGQFDEQILNALIGEETGFVHITKRNAQGFAIDGGNGGAVGQNVYLWTANENNINQQWVEIDRGNGYFSYQKRGTNYCIGGGNGGANQQNVGLGSCNVNNQNQHWQKVALGDGGYKLIKRNASGFAINGGNNGANGQNVNLYNSSNTSQNLQWYVSPIREGGIPFWLPDSEGDIRQYWSENHMIMWMSAHWLLHESYGFESRATLEEMLNHYLDVKNTYGFYEFLSPIYARYTMSALLNLADFAQDATIKTKAANAARKLMRQILQVVNDEGTFFPAAGRSFYSAYNVEGRLRPSIYLLTGLGELSDDTEISSIFIATTSINLGVVLNEWRAVRNITMTNGHGIDEGFDIHGDLERQDRAIFQWSAGGYFHPDLAADFKWALDYYDLWDHEAFSDYAQYQSFSSSAFVLAAETAAAISRSSYIGASEVKIYKHNGVVLTSIQDHWKGRAGYQQWPWVATVGKEPIFTRSGNPSPTGSTSNTTLPYVEQVDNVALIMYRADNDLSLFGFDNFDVALHWTEGDFDEVRRFGNWIVARVDDNYAAVRKHCNQTINGFEACDDQDGQTWVVVVGNSDTHGTFNNFESIIQDATYDERWVYNWLNGGYTYVGEVEVDGKSISHRWAAGVFKSAVAEEQIAELEKQDIVVYPNPASDQFEILTNEEFGPIQKVSVVNNIGQVIFENDYNGALSTITIDTVSWKSGVYFLVVNSAKTTKTLQIAID